MDSDFSSTSASICNGDISIYQQIVASSVGALTTSLMGTSILLKNKFFYIPNEKNFFSKNFSENIFFYILALKHLKN